WKSTFADLKRLTDDNRDQQDRLAKLRLKLDDKFRELQQTIDDRKAERKTADGKDLALATVKSDQGKNLMRDAREIVDAMRTAEEVLLERRDAEAKANVAATRWGIGVASGLAFVLVA